MIRFTSMAMMTGTLIVLGSALFATMGQTPHEPDTSNQAVVQPANQSKTAPASSGEKKAGGSAAGIKSAPDDDFSPAHGGFVVTDLLNQFYTADLAAASGAENKDVAPPNVDLTAGTSGIDVRFGIKLPAHDPAKVSWRDKLKNLLCSDKSQSVAKRDVKWLIQTVPDPLHSDFEVFTDTALDSLLTAAAAAGYHLDRYELPWELSNGKASRAQANPNAKSFLGVIVLRKSPQPVVQPSKTADHATQPAVAAQHSTQPATVPVKPCDQAESHAPATVEESTTGSLLVVLIVPETPTSGADKHCLIQALDIVCAAQTTLPQSSAVETTTIKINVQGPFFSGSTISLRNAALSWRPKVQPPQNIDIDLWFVTGSAMAEDNRDLLTLPERRIPTSTNEGSASLTSHFAATVRPIGEIIDTVQGYLVDQGIDPGSVAVLAEADTVYGASAAQSPNGKQSRELINQISFPMHIGSMRAAYAEDTKMLLGQPAKPAGSPRLSLELSLRSTDDPKHLLPLLSPATINQIETTLIAELHELFRRRLKAVVIVATDPRDQVFLTGLVKTHAPQTQIILVAADSIFVHEMNGLTLDGILVATNYPLVPSLQRYGYVRSNPFQHTWSVFRNQHAEGVYNAVTALLHDNLTEHKGETGPFVADSGAPLLDYGYPYWWSKPTDTFSLPPLWITAVSHNRFWPIRCLPDGGQPNKHGSDQAAAPLKPSNYTLRHEIQSGSEQYDPDHYAILAIIASIVAAWSIYRSASYLLIDGWEDQQIWECPAIGISSLWELTALATLVGLMLTPFAVHASLPASVRANPLDHPWWRVAACGLLVALGCTSHAALVHAVTVLKSLWQNRAERPMHWQFVGAIAIAVIPVAMGAAMNVCVIPAYDFYIAVGFGVFFLVGLLLCIAAHWLHGNISDGQEQPTWILWECAALVCVGGVLYAAFWPQGANGVLICYAAFVVLASGRLPWSIFPSILRGDVVKAAVLSTACILMIRQYAEISHSDEALPNWALLALTMILCLMNPLLIGVLPASSTSPRRHSWLIGLPGWSGILAALYLCPWSQTGLLPGSANQVPLLCDRLYHPTSGICPLAPPALLLLGMAFFARGWFQRSLLYLQWGDLDFLPLESTRLLRRSLRGFNYTDTGGLVLRFLMWSPFIALVGTLLLDYYLHQVRGVEVEAWYAIIFAAIVATILIVLTAAGRFYDLSQRLLRCLRLLAAEPVAEVLQPNYLPDKLCKEVEGLFFGADPALLDLTAGLPRSRSLIDAGGGLDWPNLKAEFGEFISKSPTSIDLSKIANARSRLATEWTRLSAACDQLWRSRRYQVTIGPPKTERPKSSHEPTSNGKPASTEGPGEPPAAGELRPELVSFESPMYPPSLGTNCLTKAIAVENLVGMLIVMQIRTALCSLRKLFTGCVILSFAVMATIESYPFLPRTPLALAGISVPLLVFSLPLLRLFIALSKNQILSQITGSEPQKVELSGLNLLNLSLPVLLPVLTTLVYQFPTLAKPLYMLRDVVAHVQR